MLKIGVSGVDPLPPRDPCRGGELRQLLVHITVPNRGYVLSRNVKLLKNCGRDEDLKGHHICREQSSAKEKTTHNI